MTPEQQRADFMKAAEQMDWQQVLQNGGPPCFHLMPDGRFCGRAERWPGHQFTPLLHKFISLLELLEAAYSLGWDTAREEAAKVSDKFRGQLSREEWPPFGLCQEEGRFDSGVSGLTASRIAEAIRAIPRPDILHSRDHG